MIHVSHNISEFLKSPHPMLVVCTMNVWGLRQNDAPPHNVQTLIPGTCESYLTIKKDFADVGRAKDLEMAEYSGLSRWVQCNEVGP